MTDARSDLVSAASAASVTGRRRSHPLADPLAGVAHSRRQAVPTVAVLPFENMSADPENEYFSDGMTEEIINSLSHIEGLRVTARTSAFAFKGKRPDLREVGAKLDVATVLEGGVRKAGNRIRITVRLVDVATGYDLWSERYDRELADVFAVQDEIAGLVAGRLRTSLVDRAGSRDRRRPTESLEAYEAYLRGRFYWNKGTLESYQRSREYFERALDLDPAFAQAYAGLAETLVYSGVFLQASDRDRRLRVVRAKELYAESIAVGRKLLELEPGFVLGHHSLAFAFVEQLLRRLNFPHYSLDAHFARIRAGG